MVDLSYNHGVRVFEEADAVTPIRTVQSSVVALLGTAPDADATVFPVDEPVLIQGAADAAKAAKLGVSGTLKDALDAVLDQIGAQVYVIRVTEGVDDAATLSNLVGDATTLTGVHALKKIEPAFGRKLGARLVAAPGWTASIASDGIATVAITAQGDGYTEAPTVTIAPEAGNTPTVAASAYAVLGEGDDADKVVSIVIDQPGEGYTEATTGPTVTIADPPSGVTATATVTVGAVGNPVVHELVGVLDQIRAVGFIDGPASTDAAAVEAAGKYSSDRIYMVDPMGQVWDTALSAYVSQPLSARVAGVQAKTDRTKGFWWSLSNKAVNGVDGLSRPVSYGAQTNYLNENGVGTLINRGDGLKIWGARSVGSGAARWAFLSVRRTADAVNIALEDALMEHVDAPANQATLELIMMSVRRFMATLKSNGAILDGEVWLDAAKNGATEAASGRWTISVKFEPPAPIEDLIVSAHREPLYYDVLVDTISASIRDGALAVTEN